jgi:hypothetical protein
MIDKQEAARRLRVAREEAGYPTARAAALALGPKMEQQWGDWERGKRLPAWPRLIDMAARLGLDPAILFPELMGARSLDSPSPTAPGVQERRLAKNSEPVNPNKSNDLGQGKAPSRGKSSGLA